MQQIGTTCSSDNVAAVFNRELILSYQWLVVNKLSIKSHNTNYTVFTRRTISVSLNINSTIQGMLYIDVYPLINICDVKYYTFHVLFKLIWYLISVVVIC